MERHQIDQNEKGLTLGTISTKEDIEKLRELTEANSDSIYTFRPTKKQLKKFLRDKGFSKEDIYVKERPNFRQTFRKFEFMISQFFKLVVPCLT